MFLEVSSRLLLSLESATVVIGPSSHLVLVLFRPGSRPQTRGFPLSLRAPRLHLYCTDGTNCARQISVLSLHRPTRHREDERRQDNTQQHAPVKNSWKRMPSPCSRLWPESMLLVGPAFPKRASRLLASRCFHPRRHERGRPRKLTVAHFSGDKEESLVF